MTKQIAQNLNLIGDSLILLAASAVATKVGGQPWHWLVFSGMATGSIFVWMLGGRVLQHYNSWNGRGMGGDVVLTALLLAGMLAVMATLRLVVPSYARGSHLDRFILVALPSILWLRATTSWLRRRDLPVRQVLIVGIGPLGRHISGWRFRTATTTGWCSASSVSPTNRFTIVCPPALWGPRPISKTC